MHSKRKSIREERKYQYKVSAFGAMRDRMAEKKKESEVSKVYKVYPWKAYAAF